MTRAEAIKLRGIIEGAVQSLDDAQASQAAPLFPGLKGDGSLVRAGTRIHWGGVVKRAAVDLWDTTNNDPDNAPGLWEGIDETHSGTIADPIPYEGNMALTAGLYYSQGGRVYLCNRDTVSPVYNPLSALVGIYVELA